MRVTKIAEKIGEHFSEEPKKFYFRQGSNGRGWYYRDSPGHATWLAYTFHRLQCSTLWAMKKLPGRDTF